MIVSMSIDMFIEPESDPRVEPPVQGDERTTLVGFLRWQRETFELKCSGLDADDMARRSVEPSTLSLLGLVCHMAEVERSWFRRVMAGQDAPPHFYSKADPDGDFAGALPTATPSWSSIRLPSDRARRATRRRLASRGEVMASRSDGATKR